jgi:hypothetical protein
MVYYFALWRLGHGPCLGFFENGTAIQLRFIC